MTGLARLRLTLRVGTAARVTDTVITGNLNLKFAGRESESDGHRAGAGNVNPWKLSWCFKLVSLAVMIMAASESAVAWLRSSLHGGTLSLWCASGLPVPECDSMTPTAWAGRILTASGPRSPSLARYIIGELRRA